MTRQSFKMLRCKNGHFEMALFELTPVLDGTGYWMWVPCDFGGVASGHWLAPAEGGTALVVQTAPYIWKSASAAFYARDLWERAQEER